VLGLGADAGNAEKGLQFLDERRASLLNVITGWMHTTLLKVREWVEA
jgi:hypothetical protein